jgi:hypothetical protein
MTLTGNLQVIDNGVNSESQQTIVVNMPYNEEVLYNPASFREATFNWACTNDFALNSRTASQCWTDTGNWIKTHRKNFPYMKLGLQTLVDHATTGATIQTFDALERANAKQIGADIICDVASWTFLGATNANTNTIYFQSGGVHPTTFADSNLVAPLMQNCVNRLWGNFSFSAGNSYSVTTPVATATTAGTSSGQTVTLTFASNPFPKGAILTCTGITPAGYNNSTNSIEVPFFVLSSTGTQVTYTTSGSNLGPITVQGTCTSPQSVDVDIYATLAQCTTCTHTLLPCEYYVGDSIFRKITSTSAWTITPWGTETINGGATFTAPVAAATNQPTIRLDSLLTSASAAGCSWTASIQ